jgi:hypothetical protein
MLNGKSSSTPYCVLFTLLLCACTPGPTGVPLQSSDAAPPPAIAVGDIWNYRVRDAYTGIVRGDESYRVIGIGAEISVAREGFGPSQVHAYDRQWNWLKRPATNLQLFEYQPAYPALAFPLAPGKRWNARISATDPADGRRFPVRIDAQVAGWERIKVPAGEFDTLRIERTVFFGYWLAGERGQSHILETDWYAPKVNQVVRRETRSQYWSELGSGVLGFVRVRGADRDGGGPRYVPDDWLIYELVSYQTK